MPTPKRNVKAAHLMAGDIIKSWRLTRYVEREVDRVELTPGRLGGRRGAFAECRAEVFVKGQAGPFYNGPANWSFEVKP